MKNGGNSDDEAGKLFVGGLSWETNEEKLAKYFSKYGDVLETTIMKNSETGQSRGFGFITFSDPSSVQEAIDNRPHTLDGRTIDPKRSDVKGAAKAKKNMELPKVFLGGLPVDVTESDLRTAFTHYGIVADVMIMFDHERKKCKGFGFLSFQDVEAANRCVSDHYVFVNGKKVEVKMAENRRGQKYQNGMGNTGPPDYSQQWGQMGQYGYGQTWNNPQPGWPPYPGGYGYGQAGGAPPYGAWPPYGYMPPPGMPMTGGMGMPPSGPGGGMPSGMPGQQGSASGQGGAAGTGEGSKGDYGSGSYGAAYGGGYQQGAGYNTGSTQAGVTDGRGSKSGNSGGGGSGGGGPGNGSSLGPQRNTIPSQQGYHPYKRS